VARTDKIEGRARVVQGQLLVASTFPYPSASLGAAFNTTVLSVFSTKSFTNKNTFKVLERGSPVFLGFGGNGNKVIYCPEGGASCVTQLFPITLSDKEKDQLKETQAR
jgi:hypothetical protein